MPSHLLLTTSPTLKRRLLKSCLLALFACGLVLSAPSAQSQTFVQGSVSGEWEDSVYSVIGNIFIDEHQSLVINPGVIVRFEGQFSFGVHGLLHAQGDIDQPITFYGVNQWRGIYFYPETNANSLLENCTIENAYIGVECLNAFLNIRSCSINAKKVGIKCTQSSPIISNNKLIRVSGTGIIGDVWAIGLLSGSSPMITGNQLIEAVGETRNAYGVWIDQSTPFVQNNWIEVTAPSGNAVGIYAIHTIKIVIEKNIIRVRSTYEMRNIWLTYATNVSIISNNLLLMTTSHLAICIHVDQASDAQITNNILYGNGVSVGVSADSSQIDLATSGYNDYYMHSVNHVGDWRGYREIDADPLFVAHDETIGGSDYRLNWEGFPDERLKSPCIDAGSPSIRDDAQYNTPSDIGKIPHIYNPAVFVNERATAPITYNIVNAFPNPFNRSTTLSFNLASPGLASVFVFDVNGRQLATLWNGPLGAGNNRLVWSAEGFPAGEYLIRFELPGTIQTKSVNFLP